MGYEKDREIRREELQLLEDLDDPELWYQSDDDEDDLQAQAKSTYEEMLDCEKSGEYLTAAHFCTELTELLEDSPHVYPFLDLKMAELYLHGGHGKDAREYYDQAVSRQPLLKDDLLDRQIQARLGSLTVK